MPKKELVINGGDPVNVEELDERKKLEYERKKLELKLIKITELLNNENLTLGQYKKNLDMLINLLDSYKKFLESKKTESSKEISSRFVEFKIKFIDDLKQFFQKQKEYVNDENLEFFLLYTKLFFNIVKNFIEGNKKNADSDLGRMQSYVNNSARDVLENE